MNARVHRQHLHLSTAFMAPRGGLEIMLTSAWSDTLGVEGIGIDDDFFELGGDSASASELFVVLSDLMDQELASSMIAAAPTIRALATAVDDELRRQQATTVVPVRRGGVGAPFVFVHGWGGEVTFLRRRHHQFLPERPLYGLRGRGLAGREHPLPTIEAMVDDQMAELGRAGLGPKLLIGGTCAGAVVAFEIARRLAAQGTTIEGLILLEPPHLHETAPWLYDRQRSLASEIYHARWAYRLARRRMRRALVGSTPHHTSRDFIETFERALYRYRPGRYAGRTLLVTGAHNAEILTHPQRGWPALIEGELVHRVIGRHHEEFVAMGREVGEEMLRFTAREGR